LESTGARGGTLSQRTEPWLQADSRGSHQDNRLTGGRFLATQGSHAAQLGQVPGVVKVGQTLPIEPTAVEPVPDALKQQSLIVNLARRAWAMVGQGWASLSHTDAARSMALAAFAVDQVGVNTYPTTYILVRGDHPGTTRRGMS